MRAIHCVITFLLLTVSLVASAQSKLTFLDWDILSKDTVCPIYSEVVPLESDYRQHTYTILLEYPTWETPTPEERQLAEKFREEISDTLSVKQYISVSRGQGLLCYSFFPFIRKDGALRKLTSVQITIIPTATEAKSRLTRSTTSEGRYTESSVLSSGVWKTIHITEDGIYKLTPSFLSSMGFSDISKVHLYGYGGHQQVDTFDPNNDFDDLEEVPLYKTPDGNLLFWGNGLIYWNGTERVFNAYANKATYFLTEGETRSDISTKEQFTGNTSQNVSTTLGHALYEKDEFAWYRGGRNLVENVLFSGAQSRRYNLTANNSLGNEKLTVVFTGNEVATPVSIYANNSLIASRLISAPGTYMYYSEGKFSNLNIAEYSKGGSWEITLATEIENSATDSRVQGRLDYIALTYTQSLSLYKGFVRFGGGYTGTGSGTGSSPLVTTKYSGPTRFSAIGKNASEVRIMQLGKRGDPAHIITTDMEEDGLAFSTENDEAEFVAFDPTYSFPEPTAGETIENQNLHAMEGVDMVIIVPQSDKLTAQAQRLAEAHEKYDNIKCAVVRADLLYNEFSSGTPDVAAYRRFLKMLYDRGIDNNNAPRYLLLMGDCAWDNRMLSTTWKKYSPLDYLLCYQSENSYSDTNSYCWEDYFGLMDDGEGGSALKNVSDLGIGRIPATTEEQAKIAVDKCIAHLSREEAGEWNNKVVILGDDGDDNLHMRDANRVGNTISDKNANINVRKIMWDNYVRVNQGIVYNYPEVASILDRQMLEGAMMVNYTGHGCPYSLSHEQVINLAEMKGWKSPRLPLWFTAACETMPFDSQEENFGEVALFNKGGAALAFIGTVKTVYSTQNYYINNLFSQYIVSKDSEGRAYSMGDALRLAKSGMVDRGYDGGQAQNKLQYALLGDPSLVLYQPRAKVVLDSINGVAVDGTQKMPGGSKVRLSGHIENMDGELEAGFNGMVYYCLYNYKSAIATRGNSGNAPFTYTAWEKEVNNGTDSVRNGRFQTSVIIPKDISNNDDCGRLVLYAVNDDKNLEADGFCERFSVTGYSSELDNDTIGPDIFIYLNDESFKDGDVVNSNPIFVAELHDESGIQYNGNGIGHDLQLCIDGEVNQTYNLNSYYTPVTGDYTHGSVVFNAFPSLENGTHTLSFRAWDMLNNTSYKTLRFVVGENPSPEIFSLLIEEDASSGQTIFRIAYNFPNVDYTFTLQIYSIGGSIQWQQETLTSSTNGIITIPWNGSNNKGSAMNRGLYICKVTASDKSGKSSHKEKKFIFKGNK